MGWVQAGVTGGLSAPQRSKLVRLLHDWPGGLSEERNTVRLMSQSRTEREAGERAARFGQQPGQPPPNKGRKYPAEPLTAAEVAALAAACSAMAPAGIRNRALLALLYRSGLRVSEILCPAPLRRRSGPPLDPAAGHQERPGADPRLPPHRR